MKVDGLDWIDWLHKTREQSEAERIRRGITGAEWLRELRTRAEVFERERENHEPSVARDRKPESKQTD
jgi:hypothetical protein